MSKKKKKASLVIMSVNESLMLDPSAHEVFLSFNADDDATAFLEWWHKEGGGLEIFSEWVEGFNS